MKQRQSLAVLCLFHVVHSCLGFSSFGTRKTLQTSLHQLGSGNNYLDSLTQYSHYQHQQRELQEQQQYYNNNGYSQPQEQHYQEEQQYQQGHLNEDPDYHYNNVNDNGMMDWGPDNTQLPVDTDQNMNVENDFDNAYPSQSDDYSITVEEPPVEQVLEEDFERYLQMVSTEIAVKRLNNENTFSITDVPAGVIFNQWLDSMEDALMKLRRYEKGRPYKTNRPTVVVLGSGWAAHSFVKLASTYDLRIIVVSPVNHFVFTPMLASAAVGTIEYRSMTEPIRNTNPTIDNFIEGRATAIDVENRQLTVELNDLGVQHGVKGRTDHIPSGRTFQLNYDYLVCAVGTSVRSSIVKGATEYCFNLKTSDDSKRLRTAIGEALEYASQPDCQAFGARLERQRRIRFVLIGGGPTGVELAAELNDFLGQITRRPDGPYRTLDTEYEVVLVHGGDQLLPQFNKNLRLRALQALEGAGVTVLLNTRLEEVSDTYVKLKDMARGGLVRMLPCGLSVWAAGNEPVPFVRELLSQLPESAVGTAGRINVDRWLRCPTHNPERFGSILVLGDVACLEMNRNDPNSSLPQTAQVAGQQGTFAARLLNRGYDLHVTPPKLPERTPFDEFSKTRVWLLVRGLEEAPDFVFLNLGLLAYVGSGQALTQVQLGEVPLLDLAGKRAFALWRSVYLTKQASTRNQALIALDWARTGVFGRDITRL